MRFDSIIVSALSLSIILICSSCHFCHVKHWNYLDNDVYSVQPDICPASDSTASIANDQSTPSTAKTRMAQTSEEEFISYTQIDLKESSFPFPSTSNAINDLPPLEDATNDGIDQHLPTFSEFHAMLSADTIKGDANDVPVSYEQKTIPSRSNLYAGKESREVESSATVSHSTVQVNASDMKLEDETVNNHSDVLGTVDNLLLENSKLHSADHSKFDDVASGPLPVDKLHTGSLIPDHENIQLSGSDSSVTLRRNVAAIGCFAKLLEASKSLKNPEAILNDNTDEYMNAPCAAEKWFVIETCEPVQLREIELASYELFSSRIKTFRVLISDRYPAKTWDVAGTFVARDVKGLQTFHLKSDKLIKYVKFEMFDHHGSEHYCPLTMVRLFGRVADDMDDDEDDLIIPPPSATHGDNSLFTDAVPPGDQDNISSSGSSSGSVQSSRNNISNDSSNLGSSNDPLPSPTDSRSTLSKSANSDADNGRSHTDFSKSGTSDSTLNVPVEDQPNESPTKANRFPDADANAGDCQSNSVKLCSSIGNGPAIDLDQSNFASSTVVIDEPAGNAFGFSPEPSCPLSHSRAFSPERSVNLPLLSRVKNFFTNVFHSSIPASVHRCSDSCVQVDSTNGYNLSAIPICSSHLRVIDSLIYYDLLHDPNSHKQLNLSETKRRKVLLLAKCFSHLSGLMQTTNSNIESGSVATTDRVISTLERDNHSALHECLESARLLNMTFFSGYHFCPSFQDANPHPKLSVLHLFVALQYRLRFKRPLFYSFRDADGLGLHYLSGTLSPYRFDHQDTVQCPSLPQFLMTPEPTDPVVMNNDADQTTKFTFDEQPSILHRNADTAGSALKGRIVVPGALAGSRKDTTLMRLSNRVRLLERNVSVSMRYLEELSQSYRRQMDRLTRSFNLTAAWLKATAQGAEERDLMQQARIEELEQRVDEIWSRVMLNSNESLPVSERPMITLSNQTDGGLHASRFPTPPLPNFETAADWDVSANYDTWSKLLNELHDADVTVETEDDCFDDLSKRLDFSGRYSHELTQKPGGSPDLIHTLKEFFLSCLSSVNFVQSLPSVRSILAFAPSVNNNLAWGILFGLIHFGFAFFSHLVIYLIWLRPKCKQLAEERSHAYSKDLTFYSVENHVGLRASAASLSNPSAPCSVSSTRTCHVNQSFLNQANRIHTTKNDVKKYGLHVNFISNHSLSKQPVPVLQNAIQLSTSSANSLGPGGVDETRKQDHMIHSLGAVQTLTSDTSVSSSATKCPIYGSRDPPATVPQTGTLSKSARRRRNRKALAKAALNVRHEI